MQSEAKFERIRHQRDDVASRFEFTQPSRSANLPSTAGWISAATLNPSTPLANTRTGRCRVGRVEPIDANGIDTHNKHNSRQPEKSTRRSGARFHYSGVIPVACAPSFAVFGEDGAERRGAECSGEIEANCGFNATRGTQALSLTDTLPNCWHAFCRNHLRLTSISSNLSHFSCILECSIHATLGLSLSMSRMCGNKASPGPVRPLPQNAHYVAAADCPSRLNGWACAVELSSRGA